SLARPALDDGQRGRLLRVLGPWLGRRALDELLADQRLRADGALGVGAEVVEARLVDAQDDRRLVVRRDVDGLDLADLGPRDLDVFAGDDREGVHEDRADAIAITVTGACPEDD